MQGVGVGVERVIEDEIREVTLKASFLPAKIGFLQFSMKLNKFKKYIFRISFTKMCVRGGGGIHHFAPNPSPCRF